MTEPHDVPFDDLYECRTWVRALARRLVRDEATAEDLEQQVWTAAVEHPPRRDATPSVRAWLGAVTRNAARNLRRAAGRRTAHEAAARRPERDAGAPSPESLVAEAEAHQALVAAVLALDEPYRATVLLRHFRGFEAHEIAAQQGVPVETVRTRLKRAHERLRAALDKRFGDRGAWCVLLVADRADGPVAPSAPGRREPPLGEVAATAGGIVMAGTFAKSVAAVALLVAAGAAIWWGMRGDGARRDEDRVAAADAAGRAATPDANGGALRAAPRRATAAGAAYDASPGTGEPDLPPPVDLERVDRDRDLHGIVVDQAGAPVPGATVGTFRFPTRVAGVAAHTTYFDDVAGPSARSARDGTFSLRLERAANVELRASAPGFGEMRLPDRSAGERVRVVLSPAVTLVVIAKDAAGVPIASMPVRVFTTGDQRDAAVWARGVTDASGRATFASLPPSMKVQIDCESPIANLSWIPLTLPAAGTVERELVFAGGRTIRGRVTDAATGAPVAGAAVGMNWTLDSVVRTAADGTYELTGWTGRGVRDVHVVAEGFARAEADVEDRETLDFKLARGFAVTGRVVHPGGAPAAGAIVSAQGTGLGRRIPTSFALATTGEGGTFRLDGLRRDVPHAVRVEAASAASWRGLAEPPATGDVALGDVVLVPPSRVAGRVISADGRPAARARVVLAGPEDPALGSEMVTEYEDVTDDLGRFDFPSVAPGFARLQVTPPGEAPVQRAVTVAPGNDLTGLEIVLAAARELRVRVVSDDGKPVPSARIAWSGETVEHAEVRADADGAATLRVSGGTTLRIGVWDSPELIPPDERVVGEEETDVTVTVTRGEIVSGRVVDETGTGVVGALVHLAGSDASGAFCDGTGRFELRVPPGAKGRISFDGQVLRGDDVVSRPLSGSVELGDTRRDLLLKAAAMRSDVTLRVRVLGADGRPCAGTFVFASWSGAEGGRNERTGDDGTATFSGLGERPVRITVPASSRGALANPPEFVPSGREEIVQLGAALRIAGAVERSADLPAGVVRVSLNRGGAPVATDVAQGKGWSFEFWVPDETGAQYAVEATLFRADGGDQAARGVAESVAPGTSDLRIVLTAE